MNTVKQYIEDTANTSCPYTRRYVRYNMYNDVLYCDGCPYWTYDSQRNQYSLCSLYRSFTILSQYLDY
jgi:hypothetical protein